MPARPVIADAARVEALRRTGAPGAESPRASGAAKARRHPAPPLTQRVASAVPAVCGLLRDPIRVHAGSILRMSVGGEAVAPHRLDLRKRRSGRLRMISMTHRHIHFV